MAVQLRPYQEDLYGRVQQAMAEGNRRVLVVSPCGSGKTMLLAHMVEEAQKRGKRVWVILPRQEIMEQTIDTFLRCEIPFSSLYVGMAITTANRVHELEKPDLILLDECHLSMAATYKKLIAPFPDAYIVGATASPIRTDNKPLGHLYDTLVEGVTVKWLMEHHYLAPYKYYSVTVADLTGLAHRGHDLDAGAASDLLMKPAVYGDVISNWKRFADGLQTVVYCSSVKHSKSTAKAFNDAGIPALHFDGTTPQSERKEIVERFRNGEIRVLCNCDLISMGFDMPDIGCVVLLRPTESTSLYIQQSGRALRYKPGKTAVIIDMVGNYQRFQLPDEPYAWSLDKGAPKRKQMDGEGNFTVRTCPSCFLVFKSADICPYCQEPYPLSPRELEAHEAIRLQQITAEEAKKAEEQRRAKRKQQGKARTFEELVKIGKERGYKNPAYWANMILRSRK